MSSTPLLRFGVIADPQYVDADPHVGLNRHFRESLLRITQAVETFNGRELDFVITLGDLIDRDWDSFDAVLPLYRPLRHRALFLAGNHDFSVDPAHLGAVHKRLGMPAPYHDLLIRGHRIVILDGNEVSTFALPPGHPRHEIAAARLAAMKAAGAHNAESWNGSLSEAQFAWLEQVLDDAVADGEPVLIFCHYPVSPRNVHDLWDAPRMLALLERYPSVRAYLNGHNHAGNEDTRGSTHFVTFKGMVDTPDSTAFAIVSLFEDRLEIEGFGREPSRTLTAS